MIERTGCSRTAAGVERKSGTAIRSTDLVRPSFASPLPSEFLNSPCLQIQRVRLVSLAHEDQTLPVQSHLSDEYPLHVVLEERANTLSKDGLLPKLLASGDIPGDDISNRSSVVRDCVTHAFVNYWLDYRSRDALGERGHWKHERCNQHKP